MLGFHPFRCVIRKSFISGNFNLFISNHISGLLVNNAITSQQLITCDSRLSKNASCFDLGKSLSTTAISVRGNRGYTGRGRVRSHVRPNRSPGASRVGCFWKFHKRKHGKFITGYLYFPPVVFLFFCFLGAKTNPI